MRIHHVLHKGLFSFVLFLLHCPRQRILGSKDLLERPKTLSVGALLYTRVYPTLRNEPRVHTTRYSWDDCGVEEEQILEGQAAWLKAEYGLTGERDCDNTDAFRRHLEDVVQGYLEYPGWKQFREAVEKAVEANEVGNIVCLALGTLFGPCHSPRSRR